ncbi:Uncharacterized protein dnm_029960 [Desulfonema magnum]|uniref:Uncharacterized protein n=1 Tax=Desulfonema magnum TaxID=45655 RepID=A0A975GMP1_9BACT|nr:Uncharacterized protein dnm_029960 [Desulfonema magnum]
MSGVRKNYENILVFLFPFFVSEWLGHASRPEIRHSRT